MNRRLTMLLAAFETAIVVAAGIALPLAVCTVLWGFHFQLAIGWEVFGRAAIDTWLLGHGVYLAVRLDPQLAASLALTDADATFTLSMAPLGFALLTMLLAVRTGRRIAATPNRLLGESTAIVVFAGLSLLLTIAVAHPAAKAAAWQGALLPTLVFALGLLIGSTRERLRNPATDSGSSLRDWIDDWHPHVRLAVAAALRTGAAAAAGLVAIAALLTGLQFVVHYAEIIRLYESVQAGVLGGGVITLAQLALLPNVVVWTASWLVGPGFAIGAGSSVGPIGTVLGPLPTVPLLGALPTGEHGWGLLGLLAPVVLGFVAGMLAGLRAATLEWWQRGLVGGAAGIVSGALLGLLAWASAGGVGPGRLAVVGPDPVLVGLWSALEIGLAAALGALASGVRLAGRARDETPRVSDAADRAEVDRAETGRADPLGADPDPTAGRSLPVG